MNYRLARARRELRHGGNVSLDSTAKTKDALASQLCAGDHLQVHAGLLVARVEAECLFELLSRGVQVSETRVR